MPKSSRIEPRDSRTSSRLTLTIPPQSSADHADNPSGADENLAFFSSSRRFSIKGLSSRHRALHYPNLQSDNKLCSGSNFGCKTRTKISRWQTTYIFLDKSLLRRICL